jgi:acetolactate synthase-1/3 small subunit
MQSISRHALCIFVENEFGVLQRLTSLFSARGISIEAMHTALVDEKENISQVSITLHENIEKIALIQKLLMRILIVHNVCHIQLPETECPQYVSQVLHVQGEFILQVKEILGKYPISMFQVPSNEGIFVITSSVQTVLAARHHLENIQSLVFIKEYNIL